MHINNPKSNAINNNSLTEIKHSVTYDCSVEYNNAVMESAGS